MPKNKRNKKRSIQEELALTGVPGSKAKAIPTGKQHKSTDSLSDFNINF